MNKIDTFLARIAVRNERLLEFTRTLAQESESKTDCLQDWRNFVDIVNSDMTKFAKLRHDENAIK